MLPTTTPSGEVEQIPAILLRPDGPGPFPAVVIMHDCSGLGGRSSGAPDRWARELLPLGYVVLIPDSFTTRGYPGGVCTEPPPGRNTVGPPRRVRDAYAALAFLRTLPFVNGQRVGLMGGSHGGTTTLATLVTQDTESRPPAPQPGFGAAVALYPGCAARLGGWHVTRQAGGRGPLTGHSGDRRSDRTASGTAGPRDGGQPPRRARRRGPYAGHSGRCHSPCRRRR
jgi:dienelactone hydrolase